MCDVDCGSTDKPIVKVKKRVVEVKEGGSVKLQASTKANPEEVDVAWRLQGRLVKAAKNLEIENATKQLAGVYSFVASNAVGTTTVNVTVTVKCE